MSSETLRHILECWIGPLPAQPDDKWPGTIELPFDVERFCRENDEKLDELRLAASDANLSILDDDEW